MFDCIFTHNGRIMLFGRKMPWLIIFHFIFRTRGRQYYFQPSPSCSAARCFSASSEAGGRAFRFRRRLRTARRTAASPVEGGRHAPASLRPRTAGLLGASWAQGPAVVPRCSRTGLTALLLRYYRDQHGTSNAAFGRVGNRDEIALAS